MQCEYHVAEANIYHGGGLSAEEPLLQGMQSTFEMMHSWKAFPRLKKKSVVRGVSNVPFLKCMYLCLWGKLNKANVYFILFSPEFVWGIAYGMSSRLYELSNILSWLPANIAIYERRHKGEARPCLQPMVQEGMQVVVTSVCCSKFTLPMQHVVVEASCEPKEM